MEAGSKRLNLARPGSNTKGFTPFELSLGGKGVELPKEIVPTVAGAAILINPETAPNASSFLQFARDGGLTLGLRGEKPVDMLVQAPTKFELAINLKTAKAQRGREDDPL